MAESKADGDEDHEEPEVLTEEEKMANIRAVRFTVIPKYAEILQEAYPLFVRKGAKEKTQIHESQIPHLMRSLAFNPSEEQIERLIANAKYKEKPLTQKQHYEYDNFEQRMMEFLFNEPEAFQRKSESEVLEALLVSLHGNESKANKLQMYNVSNCRKYIVILDYYEASFPCKLFPNSGQKLPRFTNTTDSLRMQTISKGRKEMDAEELKVSD
uniref:Uncharacterized protein n=1 Tax=Physcomitrium patens TaxID=3218 RepID=A0A2K1ISJ9_PHYPA|nr:hypothetical protein PHYPA_026379 [Physcomitrium patens]